MGTYLNPGRQSFQMAINSEIFVDKTEMIRHLNSVVNTQQRFVSVSRPRRFGNRTYHDEAALSYAIRLAYYAAQRYYTVVPELDSGKGYADVAYIPSPRYPDKPALVVELKPQQAADTALSQIRRQRYPERLEHYKGNILLVAISYDSDVPSASPGFKRHTCLIERA